MAREVRLARLTARCGPTDAPTDSGSAVDVVFFAARLCLMSEVCFEASRFWILEAAVDRRSAPSGRRLGSVSMRVRPAEAGLSTAVDAKNWRIDLRTGRLAHPPYTDNNSAINRGSRFAGFSDPAVEGLRRVFSVWVGAPTDPRRGSEDTQTAHT